MSEREHFAEAFAKITSKPISIRGMAWAVWQAARAQPAQAGHVPEASCGECGKKASDGWALYCVACMEKAGLPGYVLVPVDALHDWKGRVNTLATLSSKSDRYPFAAKLKQDIADAAIAQQKGAT